MGPDEIYFYVFRALSTLFITWKLQGNRAFGYSKTEDRFALYERKFRDLIGENCRPESAARSHRSFTSAFDACSLVLETASDGSSLGGARERRSEVNELQDRTMHRHTCGGTPVVLLTCLPTIKKVASFH
uniref:Secreted protein n=1 Tax=Steinernema glaseri TaxID=37863 RepID=A0A1I7YUU7_9BILA